MQRFNLFAMTTHLHLGYLVRIWLFVSVGFIFLSLDKACTRKIDRIIVHCTATPAGREVTVADIDRWHRQRGFDCIGYHYVVYLDGSVHTGRPVEMQGAHCKGYNATSIGVCYVGGLDNAGKPCDTRTDEQRASLRELLVILCTEYKGAKVYSHRDFAAKDCPCFDATTEYKDI